MSPEKVAGHIEAARAIIQRLREEADDSEWDNAPVSAELWFNLDQADEFLAGALKNILYPT